MGRKLSKTIRKLLDNSNDRIRCLDAFGNPDEEFLKILTNKTLFSVLDEVSSYRNLWKGHGGIAGQQKNKERLLQLEKNLSDIYGVISYRFDTCDLLSPEDSTLTAGVRYHNVKLLKGNKTPFEKKEIKTIVEMDTSKLYILHENQLKPIMLLPLICMRGSPETQKNACYFYNRMVGNDVRWVSYHFDKESDITEIDKEGVKLALNLILSDSSDSDNNS